MDRRTLLFISLLSLTLLLFNYYFESQHAEKMQKWREQQTVQQDAQQKQATVELQKRIAHIDELPLFSIYAEAESTELYGTAVKAGTAYLYCAPNTAALDKVFVSIADAKRVPLRKQQQIELAGKSVTIYAKNTNYQLSLANLEEAATDVQLLSIAEKTAYDKSVTLGLYQNAQLQFPMQTPEEDAWTLTKIGSEYLPAGIYSVQSKNIETFSTVPSISKIESIKVASNKKPSLDPAASNTENFYILENAYMQLVLSSKGGAIAEINLPFANDTNTHSLVREIEFDRSIQQHSPYNAYFPMHAGANAARETIKPQLGGYYPLLRRDINDETGKVISKIPPRLYALNVVSEYPEVAELNYRVKSFDAKQIVFEAEQPHRRITKTYTLSSADDAAPYCFELIIKVDGDGRNLWLTSGVPDVEWMTGAASPALKYRSTVGNKSDVKKVDLPQQEYTTTSMQPDWICNSNGFLGLIVDPLSELAPGFKAEYISGTQAMSRLTQIAFENAQFTTKNLSGYNMLLPLRQRGGKMNLRIYAGPFAEEPLITADVRFQDPVTKESHSYISCQDYHGWFAFISKPIANVLFWIMKQCYKITHSWAFSIILLTVVLRLFLYPFNAWSIKSMQKMKTIGPKVSEIQARHKKNPQQAQMEIIQLYKKEKVNPIGGCLPILLQMPFLFSMFDLLKSSFELRGAGFIPGWIDNLTSPDMLFSWGYPIYFFGSSFHLLPILLGLTMWWQQKMSSNLPETGPLTEQQRQQKMIGSVMTVVFTLMFYNFPSGLNLYWLSSMLLGVAQQWWIKRQMGPNDSNIVVLT